MMLPELEHENTTLEINVVLKVKGNLFKNGHSDMWQCEKG